jgi:hypothetical protein
MPRQAHVDRLGRTAIVLPNRFVVGLSAAIFAVAAFAATWTVTVDQPATYAEADAPVITGTIKAN